MSPARPSGGTASVGYLFGVVGARALPGTAVVPLLADLGMSVSAARTLLHRMRAAGQLVTERVGRIAVYRLAGAYLEHYQRIAFGGAVPEWNGAFEAVLYDIPEVDRPYRDQLRERAFAAGFGAPRSGLLIGVDDPAPWLADWWGRAAGRAGRGDLAVDRVRIACDLNTARRLADRAWGLSPIAADIDAFVTSLDGIGHRVSTRHISDRDALGALYEVWQEFVRIQIETPPLPAELYPDGWGLPAMQAKVYRVNDGVLPLVKRHAQRVIERVGATHLVELDPRTPQSEHAPADHV